MPLDIRGSRELQATVLAIRGAERTVRLDINREARGRISPLWKSEVTGRARTELEQRVIGAGVRATASDRGVTFYAATSRRPLKGGLIPADQWQGSEYGATTKRLPAVRQRSRSGKPYTRPLLVNVQYRDRSPRGRVAMPSASQVGTKLVALWVETTVDAFRSIAAVEITPR